MTWWPLRDGCTLGCHNAPGAASQRRPWRTGLAGVLIATQPDDEYQDHNGGQGHGYGVAHSGLRHPDGCSDDHNPTHQAARRPRLAVEVVLVPLPAEMQQEVDRVTKRASREMGPDAILAAAAVVVEEAGEQGGQP